VCQDCHEALSEALNSIRVAQELFYKVGLPVMADQFARVNVVLASRYRDCTVRRIAERPKKKGREVVK